MGNGELIPMVPAEELAALSFPGVCPETLAAAEHIVADIRRGGEAELRRHAQRLGDWREGMPLVWEPSQLRAAFEGLSGEEQGILLRTAERIRRFAQAQRECVRDLDMAVEGGRAGHAFAPVGVAGCYAPGGRFPLPSSVLMTALVARVAGVPEVWVASPRPVPLTLAAAHVAGASGLLAVGGAQAVAALALGAGSIPRCDVVVGPGNRWVTAAKKLLFGEVGIDMLAGPSELVVVADEGADARLVAADLIAQAEHDPDARCGLVATSPEFVDRVRHYLNEHLSELSTAEVARTSLLRGFSVVLGSLDEAPPLVDRLAPEHLELHIVDAEKWLPRFHNYGAIFLGAGAAEVLGDYGAGPNHVLPTGGSARFSAGLSVLTFLRARTWLMGGSSSLLLTDTESLARCEGLEGHALAAKLRRRGECWSSESVPSGEALEQVALRVVEELGREARRWAERVEPERWRKGDGSPVTAADVAIERLARKLLRAATPEFGFWGEETGSQNRLSGEEESSATPPTNPWTWICDPIDGTRSFLRRVPQWSTLLALLHQGRPVLGVALFPLLEELFVASRGRGARFRRGTGGFRSCFVMPEADFSEAAIAYSHGAAFATGNAVDFYRALHARAGETLTSGDAFGYSRVLCGALDAMVDPVAAPYDVAAVQILFEETSGAVWGSRRGIGGKTAYLEGSFWGASSVRLAQALVAGLDGRSNEP